MTEIITSDRFSGRTIVVGIIDKSGSMEHLTPEVVTGVNAWKQDIANENDDVLFNLVLFDTQVYKPIVNTPIRDVPDLFDGRLDPGRLRRAISDRPGQIPYKPSGMTNLYDAFMTAIRTVEEERRPEDRVLVNCVTDGQQTVFTTEYTLEALQEAIRRLTETKLWTFTFMSAHPDAFSDAAKYGVAAGNVVAFTADAAGTQHGLEQMRVSTRSYVGGATGQSVSFYEPDAKSATPHPNPTKKSTQQ